MKVALGSDHAAFALKEGVKQHLLDLGHDVADMGPDSPESCDYPDIGAAVAVRVARGDVDAGILTCGTGIGMSMVANKFPGVRAALVHDVFTAEMAKQHNNANVLVFGGRLLAEAIVLEMINRWLEGRFEERHQRRLDKIAAVERKLGTQLWISDFPDDASPVSD